MRTFNVESCVKQSYIEYSYELIMFGVVVIILVAVLKGIGGNDDFQRHYGFDREGSDDDHPLYFGTERERGK